MKPDPKVYKKLDNFVNSAEALLSDGIELFLSKHSEFKKYVEKENLVEKNDQSESENEPIKISVPREIYVKNILSASTQLNSNFVYLLALFERYSSDLIDICSLKSNSIFRKKLLGEFIDEHFRQIEGKRNKPFAVPEKELKKILKEHDIKIAIEYKSELGNPMDIFRKLFPETFNFSNFDTMRIEYTEARERRNLFVHRGEKIDERYTKTIHQTSTNNSKNNQKKITKVLNNIHSLNVLKDKDNLSVSPQYLVAVTGLLYVLSHAIFFSTFKLTKKEVETETFPLNLQHEFMILAMKYPALFIYIELVYIIYVNKFCKSLANVEKIPDRDKVNLALLKNYQLKLFKNQEKLTNVKKDRDTIVSKISNENQKNAVKAVISNNNEEILNSIKNLLNDPDISYEKEEMKKWFMYQDYLKDKKFLKAFEEI